MSRGLEKGGVGEAGCLKNVAEESIMQGNRIARLNNVIDS
jgi:hypothetical protein